MHMESNSFDGITDTSPVVLSWGRRDLGTLLAGSEPIDGVFRYDSKFRCDPTCGKWMTILSAMPIGPLFLSNTPLGVSFFPLCGKLHPRSLTLLFLPLLWFRTVRQIASSSYHTACLTSTGEIIMCGSNDEGQIAADETQSTSELGMLAFPPVD